MWFLKHRKTGTKGFSLVEIIVVMTIVSVLVAIAVPTALQQRKKSSDSAMKADALQIATGMQNALYSWNGTPPADVPLTFATPTWSITYGANTIVSGSVSTGDVVSGTIWADGSYCAQVVNSSGSNNWIIRSDTGQLTSGTCPSTALGGLGSLPTSTTVTLPGVPGNLSVINTLGVDNSIDVFWSAVAGATSYLVNVTGVTPITVTAPAVNTTVTNIPGGDTTVSVRAVNASGSGQASATNITVLGGTLFSTGVTTPLTAGSGSATLERVQIGTTGLGLGGTSLTSDASTIKFGTNASSATAAWIAGRTDGGVNFYTQSAGGSIINNLSLTPTINTFNNNLSVSASTTSTSSTTGALTVTGGTGVGGNLYVGGNLVLTGTCTGCSGGASYTAPTIGSTLIPSGATVTTIAGLTLTAPIISGLLTANNTTITSTITSTPALIVKGAISQSADLAQFQDSGANILARVDSYGNGAFANNNASRVKVATTVALASSSYTNGTSGIGATLTESTNGVLAAIDGYTPVVGDRILIKNQATTFQNGIYSITNAGTAITPWILTRSTDSDTAAKISIGFVGVDQGATNTGTFWNTNFTSANTIGTTALTYSAFTSGSGAAITVTDDTTTNANYYPSLSLATSGTLSAVKTSSTKLSFNPSSGILTASAISSASGSQLGTTYNILKTNNPAYPALVTQGSASQTANLQEWQNSAGTVLSMVNQNGVFVGLSGFAGTSFTSLGGSGGKITLDNSTVLMTAATAAQTPSTIQGVAGQTADLLQIKNSSGTVVSRIASDGGIEAANGIFAGYGSYAAFSAVTTAGFLVGSPGNPGLIVRGATAQTADLLQLQNSSGSSLVKVDAYGQLYSVQQQITQTNAGAIPLQITGAPLQTADLLQIKNNAGTLLANVDALGNASFANQYSSRVKAASTASLTVTYSNGTAGVGATLTNAGAQVAFAIDGYTAVVGDRILIKDQATGFQNGIYTITNIGSGASNWVLTRATDSDTAPKLAAGLTAVDKGITNTGTYWKTSFSSTNVIGTDGMTWTPFTSGTGAAATITDDNSTNANYYLTLSTTNTGSLSAIKTASTKLTFNPSSGILTTAALTVNGAATFNGSLTVNGNTDKVRVRIATTSTGTLATSFANGQTVDGVILATGDRILIKNQATSSENGIYTVNASGAPTRATDADAASKISTAFVAIDQGTTLSGTYWYTTFKSTDTVGTTGMNWVAFGTGGGAYTAPTLGSTLIPSGATVSTIAGLTLTAPAINTGADSNIGVIVKGNSVTQTADLQQWKNSAGTVLANVTAGGVFGSNYYTEPTATSSYLNLVASDAVYLYTRSAANKGLVVKGSASQTADLFQVQDNLGNVPTRIDNTGQIHTASGTVSFFGTNTNLSATLSVQPVLSSAYGLAIRGLAGQTGDLQQWQNSTGTVLATLSSGGALTASQLIAPSIVVITNGNIVENSATGPYLNLSGSSITLNTRVASNVGLIIQGATSQTADLQQWRNGAGTVLVAVGANGVIATGTTAGAPTIVSATTITPITPILFVSGTTTIQTITAPAPISTNGGSITIVPTGAFSTNTAGNIAIAVTAIVNQAITLTYDPIALKWYPASSGSGGSYTAPTIGSTLIPSGATVSTIAGLTLTSPNLGTPSVAVLTNATGLPISTGVSGLGAGIATFLATPTTANFVALGGAATGSGSIVLQTSPTLTTPAIGVASGTSLTTTSDSSFSGVTFGAGGSGIATNLAAGAGALTANATAQNIVALGRAAGNTLTAGGNDIIIGYNAQPSSVSVTNEITFGDTNVNRFRIPGIGLNATGTTGTGSFVLNTSPTLTSPVLGVALATSITTSTDSSFGGIPVGSGGGSITTNSRMGVSALLANTTGSQNTALGYIALSVNTIGAQNTALGSGSLQNNLSGNYNTAVGQASLPNNTIGTYNTAVGQGSLTAETIGTQNTGIGINALSSLVSGNYNTAVGGGSLQLTSNSSNSALGVNSLSGLTTGSVNTAIGFSAGNTATTGSNNSFIGNNAQPSAVGVSNEITLGNASVTSFRIPGLGLTASGVTGTGSFVMGTSPVLVTPNLGTPSFITLTNATGLPISTGISGLGAGVATFLATANSTNLIAAMSGFTTGTGNVVFSTSPTLTTPNITDPKLHIAINPQVGTTYTFVLADDGKLVTSTNGTAQIFSIPTNASVAYPVGTQINIVQLGTAQITVNAVTPGTTSIISNASAPASPKTRVQYSSMTLIKLATDQWYVVGDIV